MKKKIAALLLAVTTMMSATAFAQTLNVTDNGNALTFEQKTDSVAVVICYDENGTLQYSNMYKATEGLFSMAIPQQYKDMEKKVYLVDSKEFRDVEVTATATPTPTTAPEATDKPAVTTKPTATPSANQYPSIYEKAVNALNAPAVVKSVETRSSDGEDIYAVTMFYHGKEVTVGIKPDVTFTTAPQAYSFMKGEDMGSLEEGDVITFSLNIAGDTVKRADFIFRPQDEDIVTSTTDFGTNFEKLISENGTNVANQWKLMTYGAKASSDKYQYAFGVVGKKSAKTLTLVNKSGDEDKAIELDIQNDTIVYTCDVSNKNEVEIGSVSDIATTIPKSAFDNGTAELNDEYSYNYALVRTIDGLATDIVVYNNYNE